MAARVDSFMIARLLELDRASPGRAPPGFLVGLILKNTRGVAAKRRFVFSKNKIQNNSALQSRFEEGETSLALRRTFQKHRHRSRERNDRLRPELRSVQKSWRDKKPSCLSPLLRLQRNPFLFEGVQKRVLVRFHAGQDKWSFRFR